MFNIKKQVSKTVSAFSFMEVILVIAIIGIMTSAVFASISQSKNRTELETAANEVVASIRKIQNYSLSGKNISVGCTKYTLNTTNGSNSFTINNGGATCPYNVSYKLKNGVTFGNSASVSFNAPFGNRDNTNTVDIDLIKGSNHRHVCITGVGVITMQYSACP